MAQVDATYMQHGHLGSIPVELTDRFSELSSAMGPPGSGGGEQNPHARAYAEAKAIR
jgi:hypothetical protein